MAESVINGLKKERKKERVVKFASVKNHIPTE